MLAVFWILATLVRRVARAGAQYIDDQTTRLLVTQVTYYLVWAVGFSVALDAVGVNLQSAVTALESRQRHPHSRNAPIRDRR